jgi:hypothetical protein
MSERINPALLQAKAVADPDAKVMTRSGAMTSGSLPPLELVTPALELAVARRMQKGLDKGYPRANWMIGLDDPDFIRDRMRHFKLHLGWLMSWGSGGEARAAKAGDGLQQTVDAVAWGAHFMAEAMENHTIAFVDAVSNSQPEAKSAQGSMAGQTIPNGGITGGSPLVSSSFRYVPAFERADTGNYSGL